MTRLPRLMAAVGLVLALLGFSNPPGALATPASASPAREGSASAPQVGVDLGEIVQVSAGGAHTCAVTRAGGVKCWGDNRYGQLGDGTTRSRGAPVDVLGLSEGVVMVSAGGSHTCALTAAGGVKCWGNNRYGQLGDGATTSRPVPADILEQNDTAQAVSSGSAHSCALMTGRAVRCWGKNDLGQLGDGTTIMRLAPVDVVGLANGVRAVDAGASHACAITAESRVKCWGDNNYGALGDGTTMQRLTPVTVLGLTDGVQAVNAGDGFSCAVNTAGSVKCWGHGSSGELGNGSFVERQLTPVDVVDLAPGVRAVSAGGAHACAIKEDGGAACWGLNWNGQVGVGSTTSVIWRPVDVVGLANAVMGISANGRHSCAVLADGGVKCWGWNKYGQLGDGGTVNRSTPVDVWDMTAYDCTAVTELPLPECQALVTFFEATNGPLWVEHTGWLRTATPCSWYGVTCAAGHVSALDLPANNLVDALPAALGNLSGLQRLDLHGNELDGEALATVSNLNALPHLDLSISGLSGAIPAEVGNLGALQTLDLHGNALSGTLPAELGNLRALQSLDLSENALTGPLPAGLADLTQLRTLDLHANQLAGPLPADPGRLVALQTLDLSANLLTGPLPAGLGEAAALLTVDLSHNALSGPLPWTWSHLSALERLDLAHNGLTGELPPEWSLLPALQQLDLSYNALEGWLPSAYGQWTTVTHLDLSFNALRGPLPAAWSGLSRLQILSLNNNHLAGAIPPEWRALGSAGLSAGASAPAPDSSAWWTPLPPGVYLDLSCNRLSGAIPVEIAQIRALQAVNLASNQLRGSVPAELNTPHAPHAYVEDNLLVDLHDGTQTVPPTNLRARLSAPDTAVLTWEPVLFGFESYEVSYATAPAGPYILHGQVPSSPDSYSVSGLLPGAPYYFRVRTFSPAHGSQSPGWGDLFEHAYYQQSNLWSDYTPLVSVNVAPRVFLPLVGVARTS